MPGCPYDPQWANEDCSGRTHGECITENNLYICECSQLWEGSACHIPDCPGDPEDCYERGTCNTTTGSPMCTNCSAGWMGPACNDPCVHGTQTPMDSGNCICEPGRN